MEFEQDIHPTAIIHQDAILHNNVKVGAYSVIGGSVELGEDTEIGNHVNITGHTKLGKSNKIYHSSSIGEQPQDMKYKNQETLLEIGDRNTIREFCTINTGTVEGNKKTLIGNDNWIMAYVHIAHDCIVKNNIVIANSATLAGHVEVDDYVIIGGLTAIHQFCKIGQHAITMGGTLLSQDVPPYVRAVSKGGMAFPNGINSEGLRRRGFTAKTISDIKNGYKVIYMRDHSVDEAKKELSKLVLSSSEVGAYIDFIERSNRGLIRPSG
ncbi:acyl-ACP--UDP-N-acetylglucosamine O-acyltransferase [Methylophilales bacterium]|nr:acyl-ACP--UDP-N-acetylglucosamine O-acyltransferase [Methylophilales bacterium]